MQTLFDQVIACAEQIEKRFRSTGVETYNKSQLFPPLRDVEFTSDKYRRAHISTVDARNTKKLYLLHVTVFPHTNDSSPIYGFDIVCGPTKVSGAFHDFSDAGNPRHFMMRWFADVNKNIEWNKPRELPNWAKEIFSPGMVAIGAVGEQELSEFINLGLETLDYYLEYVGLIHEPLGDYRIAQNRYSYWQKQNPRTPASLQHLGFTEQEANNFVEQMLFPEIG